MLRDWTIVASVTSLCPTRAGPSHPPQPVASPEIREVGRIPRPTVLFTECERPRPMTVRSTRLFPLRGYFRPMLRHKWKFDESAATGSPPFSTCMTTDGPTHSTALLHMCPTAVEPALFTLRGDQGACSLPGARRAVSDSPRRPETTDPATRVTGSAIESGGHYPSLSGRITHRI